MQADEWLFAEGTSGNWYVVHTTTPLFIAEIIDPCEEEYDHLVDGERGLAVHWYELPDDPDEWLEAAGIAVVEFDREYDDDANEAKAQAMRTLRNKPSDN